MRQDAASMLSAGLAALDAGDLGAAEQQLRAAVGLQPSSHAAWNALAWTYLRAGEAALAVEHAQHAHGLAKRNEEYLNTLGVALAEAGALEDAEAALRRALKVRPAYPDALVNLGKVLEKAERLDEAAQAFSRALAIAPGFPMLGDNLASVHMQRGDLAAVRRLLQAAEGENAAILLAACELDEGHAEAALARLGAAVAAHPQWFVARSLLANTLLACGRWRAGWTEYRWRRHVGEPGLPAPAEAPLPQDLRGRSVLVKGDQGIGDVLFFLRFLPRLEARGARVAVSCEPKLQPLLEGVALAEAGAFDHALWAGDLPWALAAEGPEPARPLSVPAGEREAARERLAALGPPPYLGVTWRAGTDLVRGPEMGGRRRALTKAVQPRALGEALRGWPGSVVLLQRAARPGDAAEFAAALQAPAHDLSFLGEDLRALLGVLAVLDEYVGVSSTNMHMMAGLGRTARVLVPRPPEWRWMLEGGQSPWFPGFPLYRQAASRDWSEPLARLRKDLLDG